MSAAFTPGPWRVRTRESDGEIVDCFVTAPDVHGYAYDAEILGEDEYREGIERRVADCHLIAAAPELLEALEHIINGALSLPRFAEEQALAALAKARSPQ